MTEAKTLSFKFERTLPAPQSEVYDAWLNPEVPGNPWSENEKLVFNPHVDGLFYWRIHSKSHYGLFTEVNRPSRISHTWCSPHTLGLDSIVTVSFEKKGEGTLMTLEHTGLPDNDLGRGHERGWNYFLDKLVHVFDSKTLSRKS